MKISFRIPLIILAFASLFFSGSP